MYANFDQRNFFVNIGAQDIKIVFYAYKELIEEK